MKKKKTNRKLFFIFLFVVFTGAFLFYADCLLKTNSIDPIMTKTEEEANYIEEETSAHSISDGETLPPLPNQKDRVILNKRTLKYHKADCEWVKECNNCVTVSKAEAIKQGAVPCKSCI